MLIFQPSTPEQTASVLDACTDPALTLRDIAQNHDTTVEALSLWLSTPEIAERLNDLHSIAATRTRFLAAVHLSRSIDALSEVLIRAKSALRSAPPTTPASSPSISDTAPPTPAIIQVRLLETTRRAATTLISLSRTSSSALAWRGKGTSEARAQETLAPSTPAPPRASMPPPRVLSPLHNIFAPPCPGASSAPPPFAAEVAAASIASDSPSSLESRSEAPATIITDLLAQLSKVSLPAAHSDCPQLTPEQAAYAPGPDLPTLGQLETLAAYLNSIHPDDLADERPAAASSPLLASTASNEHWP